MVGASGDRVDQLREELARAREINRRRELSEALYRANREKVFAPRVDWTRKDWQPLSALSWEFPEVNDAEAFRRRIKDFITGVGWAVVVSLEQLRDLQFVLLFLVGLQDGVTRFTVLSPYEAPLACIEQIGEHDPAALQRWNTDVAAFDFQHRYGVVVDRYVPIVVGWEAARRTLILTNRNQMNSPEQFLNPSWCTTTSGLLNLVGTLSMHSRDAVFDDLQASMNSGLDEWFRWLYYALDTGVQLDRDRLLVRGSDPERYVYDYNGQEPGA